MARKITIAKIAQIAEFPKVPFPLLNTTLRTTKAVENLILIKTFVSETESEKDFVFQ